MKTHNGLKSIASIISIEEQNNQALISELSASSNQTPVPAIIVPPPPPSDTTTDTSAISNQSVYATIATLAQDYPVTNVKLNSILRI